MYPLPTHLFLLRRISPLNTDLHDFQDFQHFGHFITLVFVHILDFLWLQRLPVVRDPVLVFSEEFPEILFQDGLDVLDFSIDFLLQGGLEFVEHSLDVLFGLFDVDLEVLVDDFVGIDFEVLGHGVHHLLQMAPNILGQIIELILHILLNFIPNRLLLLLDKNPKNLLLKHPTTFFQILQNQPLLLLLLPNPLLINRTLYQLLRLLTEFLLLNMNPPHQLREVV